MAKPPHLANRPIRGQINERGIESWSVKWWTETYQEGRSVGEARFLDFPQKGRTIEPTLEGPEELGYYTTIIYEGLGTQGPATYGFQPSTSKEPVERSPDLKDILRVFGGTVGPDGRVKFSPEMPRQFASAVSGFSQTGGNGEGVKNPLFGWEDILTFGGVWTETKAYSRLPSDLFTDVWKISAKVPGGLPTPPGRDWMMQPPTATRRGSEAWEIGRNWMLSPAGGWPPVVSQLLRSAKRVGGGPGQGLTTGSLTTGSVQGAGD